MLAAAQTGTGKTAAFALPILDRLREHASTSFTRAPSRSGRSSSSHPRARRPGRRGVRTYGRSVPLRATVVYGGVPIEPQTKILQAGVEILVATPGRLLDHVQQRTVNLSQVSILVLDEADRMLDMGFLPDIRKILALLPARARTCCSRPRSMTRSGAVRHDPARSGDDRGAPRNTAAEAVRQLVYPVDRDRKEAPDPPAADVRPAPGAGVHADRSPPPGSRRASTARA